MRERTQDGVTAEITRLMGEVEAASRDLYQLHRALPDDETLALCGITCVSSLNYRNLTGSSNQIGLSLAISRGERFNMPNSFFQILSDVVDGWSDLMVTFVLNDRETAEDDDQSDEFGLILGSSVPQRDKVTIGIPSNPDRGLFVTTWPSGPKTAMESFYQNLHGRRIDSKFTEGLVAACGWLIPKIQGRIYHGTNITPIELFRRSA